MSDPALEPASPWSLEPGLAYLNHGAFGACPLPVLAEQARLREELERQPTRFLAREIPDRLAAARAELAAFVGADPDDLAAVVNPTHGVNTVLRALSFSPGDDLLTTDHEYNASANALAFAAERAGARVVVARVPFPLASPDEVLEAVLSAVTPRTRLALIDHVTSPTGLVFPLERLARELTARGVEVLVDGAHGPGMVEVDLRRLADAGVSFYAGHGHKWLCAPKGAAFLWVRRDRQPAIRPLAISHGATAALAPGQSRFRAEFDWTGTWDPTPFLCLPAAIRFLEGLLPGGWPALRASNRAKALAGRRLLAEALGIPDPAPAEMIGCLAALPLPEAPGEISASAGAATDDPLQGELLERHGIEVPIFSWPAPPRRLIRISAQLYNREEDYRSLASALAGLGPAEL